MLAAKTLFIALCSLWGMYASANAVSLFKDNKPGQAAIQIYTAIFSLILAASWIF